MGKTTKRHFFGIFPSFIKNKTRVQNVKFLAGSIFKIQYKLIWKCFKDINLIAIYDCLETEYTTNEKSTYVHAMERIISGFVYNPNINI